MPECVSVLERGGRHDRLVHSASLPFLPITFLFCILFYNAG